MPIIFNSQIDSYIYAICIFVFFQLFRALLRKILYKLVQKTSTSVDDEVLEAIKKPIDFLFVIIGINFALTVLFLDDEIVAMIDKFIRSGFIVVVFWSVINILNHLSVNIHKITNKFGDKINADFSNFIVKSIRFFILILGFIAVLQEWGYNVSGFLASLGLIGMAFALAAKDTAGNLFGSLVIFTDKPFKIGDWIKTPEVEGTIENVGIRSTKVRTFAQALVSVPNGTLANSAILNWSKMGKGRVKTSKNNKFYEQRNLQLDINKAKRKLKWHPTYSVRDSVKITTEWYLRVYVNKEDPFVVTNQQIRDYMNENSRS